MIKSSLRDIMLSLALLCTITNEYIMHILLLKYMYIMKYILISFNSNKRKFQTAFVKMGLNAFIIINPYGFLCFILVIHAHRQCMKIIMTPKYSWQLGSSLQLRWQRICLKCKRPRFDLWVGKVLWRREWQSTPAFLPGESHGQRSPAGHSPWGHKELDTTE